MGFTNSVDPSINSFHYEKGPISSHHLKTDHLLTGQYKTGLDIINSTNLDYFSVPQKAEFFQLKGEFYVKMGLNEEAHTAYSTAVSIYDNLAKG